MNQYHFGAFNRLEKAVNNQTGEVSIYEYNGLGHRVGKTIGNPIEPSLPTDRLQDLTINPTKQIEDTIDLTKQYHNLLRRREDNNTTAYTWDSNVLHAVGEGASEQSHYQYLQDELGSPIRLLTGDGIEQEVYGYDEFGMETVENNSSKGFMQPFTYTGYQRDSIASTYYAQAREYTPNVGRFTGEDIIKGSMAYPLTLNPYVYCWNYPTGLVDVKGETPSQWNPGVETDYSGVYYLNSENGAYTFGHAAMMFMRDDGSGTFYSFAASESEATNIILGNDVPGYLSKAELSAKDVQEFFGHPNADGSVARGQGQLKTDGIDGDIIDGSKTNYTRAIHMPITLQEGKVMSYYAEQLRDAPGNYNLYSRNCGMVVQDILRRGQRNFAAASGEGKNKDEQGLMILLLMYPQLAGTMIYSAIAKDYLDQTIPNGSYDKGWIMTNIYLHLFGYKAGNLEDFVDMQYGECENE